MFLNFARIAVEIFGVPTMQSWVITVPGKVNKFTVYYTLPVAYLLTLIVLHFTCRVDPGV